MESLFWSSTCDHALNERWVFGTRNNGDSSECTCQRFTFFAFFSAFNSACWLARLPSSSLTFLCRSASLDNSDREECGDGCDGGEVWGGCDRGGVWGGCDRGEVWHGCDGEECGMGVMGRSVGWV